MKKDTILKNKTWKKPIVKTISKSGLKKIIALSACSEYEGNCPRMLFR